MTALPKPGQLIYLDYRQAPRHPTAHEPIKLLQVSETFARKRIYLQQQTPLSLALNTVEH